MLVDTLKRLRGPIGPTSLGSDETTGERHDERGRHTFAAYVGHYDAESIRAKRDEIEEIAAHQPGRLQARAELEASHLWQRMRQSTLLQLAGHLKLAIELLLLDNMELRGLE